MINDIKTMVEAFLKKANLRDNKLSIDIFFNWIDFLKLSLEDYEAVISELEKRNIKIVLDEPDPNLLPQIDDSISDSLGAYLRDISQYNLLSKDKEAELFKAYNSGNKLAKDQLVNANLRLVVSIAKRYTNHGLSLNDLIQEGNLGLMKAIDKYDLSRGTRFSTFASYWIRKSITLAIDTDSRTIRIPSNVIATLAAIDKARASLIMELDHEPTSEEIVKELHGRYQKNQVEHYLNFSTELTSLDEIIQNTDDLTMLDLISDQESATPSEYGASILEKELLEKAFATLTLQEQEIIGYRYGFIDGDSHTLEDIAKRFNTTKQSINLKEKTALAKLRKILVKK